jgi:hypothetical protein
MCVSNPDCLPVGIHARHTAPTPTGFAEIVSDDFLLIFLWRAVARNYDEGS